MIIKRPEKEHIPALTGLWMQAFGDRKDFIDGFFRTGFSYDRCLLAQEQGQLLAALYWFDCAWQEKKIAYLYAIATDEHHRGKGICKQLMEHTHQALKKQGYVGAILVPADENLARMYGKIGYQSVISTDPERRREGSEKSVMRKGADLSTPHLRCSAQDDRRSTIDANNLSNHLLSFRVEGDSPESRNPFPNYPLHITPISVEEYRTLQEKLLPENAVVHTDAAFSYLQTFAKFYKTKDGILCKTEEKMQECLPGNPVEKAMYFPLTEDNTLPGYFALPMA